MSEWDVDPAQRAGLSPWLTLALGATTAHPGAFPPEFHSIGINPRTPPRNTLVGSTVSHPTADEIVIGVTFFDTHDNGDNEDYYVYDVVNLIIRKYAAQDFERRYPQYANTHRGYKGYLRGVEPPPAGT